MKKDIEMLVQEYRERLIQLEVRRSMRERARKRQLFDIKKFQAQGMTLREIGEHYGVSKQRIHQILRGSKCE